MTFLSFSPQRLGQAVLAAALTTEECWVPAGAARIYVRRKVSESAPADKRPVLLMVHGSTYPAEATFDLPIGGISMADVLATAGIDVWFMDVAGYGASSRPEIMDLPPDEGAPVARTDEAVTNVEAVVQHILDHIGRPSLSLLGWSWGTTLMGAFAAAQPDRVTKLAQIAPQWLRDTPSPSDPGGSIGCYRDIDADSALARWGTGLSPEARKSLIPAGADAALRMALLDADSDHSRAHPGRFRAPNGTVADSRDFWMAGRPIYDPSLIRCPVLVVHGEWDYDLPLDMARAYFAQITGAPYRKWIEISEATHSLVMEKNRMLVFDAVAQFLHEDYKPSDWL